LTRKYTNRRYLDALKDHVLVFDGAMGTNLQKQNLTASEFGVKNMLAAMITLFFPFPLLLKKSTAHFWMSVWMSSKPALSVPID